MRFIAGIYLSLIYINRGFGIVALTHAFYDLFVIYGIPMSGSNYLFFIFCLFGDISDIN